MCEPVQEQEKTNTNLLTYDYKDLALAWWERDNSGAIEDPERYVIRAFIIRLADHQVEKTITSVSSGRYTVHRGAGWNKSFLTQ